MSQQSGGIDTTLVCMHLMSPAGLWAWDRKESGASEQASGVPVGDK